MPVGLIFWILYLVGIVFFGYDGFQDRTRISSGGIFWWVLILLLGVGVFGNPIK